MFIDPTTHEIITGDQAELLPVGSVILSVDGSWPLTRREPDLLGGGVWWTSATDTRGETPHPEARFHVLHVPHQPPTPIEVGTVVTTPAQIERLPAQTVLMDINMGHVVQLWLDPDDDVTRLWQAIGETEDMSDVELAANARGQGYRVVWLPEGGATPAGWAVVETTCPGGC